MGLRVRGLSVRVWEFGFRVQRLGFWVSDFGLVFKV